MRMAWSKLPRIGAAGEEPPGVPGAMESRPTELFWREMGAGEGAAEEVGGAIERRVAAGVAEAEVASSALVLVTRRCSGELNVEAGMVPYAPLWRPPPRTTTGVPDRESDASDEAEGDAGVVFLENNVEKNPF